MIRFDIQYPSVMLQEVYYQKMWDRMGLATTRLVASAIIQFGNGQMIQKATEPEGGRSDYLYDIVKENCK
ncbi:hypothetical protein chiPu_0017556 [Chiloscyllium punctatum]|uniref:Uncharacterized protein n=1 Tax=Chiloscyllium punctatum TaxID=137246 RepID=A0A401RH18_CHIPU|nr:hypothetical protein [Chiloscyllium punctatum]